MQCVHSPVLRHLTCHVVCDALVHQANALKMEIGGLKENVAGAAAHAAQMKEKAGSIQIHYAFFSHFVPNLRFIELDRMLHPIAFCSTTCKTAC